MSSPASGGRILAGAFLALGGAAVTGFVLGLHEGPLAMGAEALTVATLVLAVAIVMVPPLYIATAALGFAPPAGEFVAGTAESLRRAGIVLFGLAPPLAFLTATSGVAETRWLLANAVVGLAAVLAVRALWYRLFAREGDHEMPGFVVLTPQRASLFRGPMAIYLLWLAVGASVASSLFQQTFE